MPAPLTEFLPHREIAGYEDLGKNFYENMYCKRNRFTVSFWVWCRPFYLLPQDIDESEFLTPTKRVRISCKSPPSVCKAPKVVVAAAIADDEIDNMLLEGGAAAPTTSEYSQALGFLKSTTTIL